MQCKLRIITNINLLRHDWADSKRLDSNIRVDKNDLGSFAEDSSLIKLSDGSGYAATMAVFHGLHCIERLHHFIHRSFYYEGFSDEEEHRLIEHTG